jgi:hypothetical protein
MLAEVWLATGQKLNANETASLRDLLIEAVNESNGIFNTIKHSMLQNTP